MNARAAGPRLGQGVQPVIKAAKAGDWSLAEDGSVVAGGVALAEGEYSLETVVADDSGHSAVAVLPGGGFVVLDTELTPELEAEGWARDLVRQIQDERKSAGLHVSDPIRLRLSVPERHLGTTRQYQSMLEHETLAREVEVVTIDGETVLVVLERLA